jgi:hypothetical protein
MLNIESDGIGRMKPKTENIERRTAVEPNGRAPSDGALDRNAPALSAEARKGILLPQRATGCPESKVTWQGFVDWMAARGAHAADA